MSPRHLLFRFCVALLMVGVLFGLGQKPVHSEPDLEIVVNSFEDLPDNIDNDVCSAGDPTEGPCTLRAAISWANWRINTRNIIIKLPAGVYTLTIPPNYGTSNDNLTGDLNINSPGVAITNTVKIEPSSGGSVVIRSLIDDRIFSLNQHARVTINNITLREGHAVLDTNNPNGGGAILNRGFLSLNGVSLLSNTVTCAVEGPCASAGGAIENWGTLTIQDSTLDGNTALQGGAILNGSSPSANLTIRYSTLSNNQNTIYGTIANNADLSIINSTFSSNSNISNSMSGIHNAGTLRLQSTTMANLGDNNAIFNTSTGQVVVLKDNIFKAEPGYANCYVTFGGIWTSGEYNIANDASCNPSGEGNLTNTDPLLGSLGNWGGPTKTIMLNWGSPAIDHRLGNCQLPVNFLIDDQSHWLRSDGKCDTGAFESPPHWVFLPLISK